MKTASQGETLAVKIAFLRTVPLFAHLSDAGLGALAADFFPVEYPKDNILFWHGESSTELYLVRKGKVRIYTTSLDGGETSINIFSTGDIIGEFAAIDRQPRSATAQTITHCLLWRMDADAFVQHLRTIPDMALALNRILVGKLRWTAQFAETAAQYQAEGRLLHLLLLYNEKFGEALETGKRYKLDLGLNQGDLASLVGVRREWINRLLQTWQRQGWIEYKAGKILIHDLTKMQRERDRHLEGNTRDLRGE